MRRAGGTSSSSHMVLQKKKTISSGCLSRTLWTWRRATRWRRPSWRRPGATFALARTRRWAGASRGTAPRLSASSLPGARSARTSRLRCSAQVRACSSLTSRRTISTFRPCSGSSMRSWPAARPSSLSRTTRSSWTRLPTTSGRSTTRRRRSSRPPPPTPRFGTRASLRESSSGRPTKRSRSGTRGSAPRPARCALRPLGARATPAPTTTRCRETSSATAPVGPRTRPRPWRPPLTSPCWSVPRRRGRFTSCSSRSAAARTPRWCWTSARSGMAAWRSQCPRSPCASTPGTASRSWG
mmetsp:Transcript_3305/g.13118  ORF Transcript_3305/g.13118 Transcript_3305/m.13118 type:complete len:297 (+) Transcript_3305:458-1348(+)